MVAMSTTDSGVEFDPLVKVRVHPAAELFPLLQGAEFDELVRDIREHGLREPIVFTPTGEMLDGRNRYRACKKIRDEEPTTRVEHSEPWTYVISVNLHRRHLTDAQRQIIGGKMAERTRGGDHGNQHVPAKTPSGALASPPPTHAQVAELLDISGTSLDRARKVVKADVPGLVEAVETGRMKVATAVRIIEDVQPNQREEIIKRINNGANPRHVIPGDSEQSRHDRAARNAKNDAPLVGNNKSKHRHRYLNTPALQHLQDEFDALELVLNSTEGLDPSITSEQAGLWLTGLSKGRTAIGRLIVQLKERKESTS